MKRKEKAVRYALIPLVVLFTIPATILGWASDACHITSEFLFFLVGTATHKLDVLFAKDLQ